MYGTGKGVPQDYAEALRWYRLAAEQGYADAQASLGLMYYDGKGVPQDYAEALRWFRLAAEQGNADAQFNLGVMYYDGEGVPQDYLRAHMWVNLAGAAVNGFGPAQELRNLIAAGMTPSDISKAQEMARECFESGYQNCGD